MTTEHPHGKPCRALFNYAAPPHLQNHISFKKGAEGQIYREIQNRGLVQFRFDSDGKYGWAPKDRFEISDIPGNSPIKVESQVTIPSSVKLPHQNINASLLSRTLEGMLHTMSTLLRTTRQLSYLHFTVQALLKSDERIRDLVSHIINGLNRSISNPLQAGRLDRSHLRHVTTVQEQGGCGVYGIYYQMPGAEQDAVYIGQSIDMMARFMGHQAGTRSSSEKPHYVLARRAAKSKMFILCELPKEPELLSLTEQLFVLLFASYQPWLFHLDSEMTRANIQDWAGTAIEAQNLTKIMDDVRQQTGWQKLCKMNGWQGLNITSPAVEYGADAQLRWFRNVIPGHGTDFKRPPARAWQDKNGSLSVTITHSPNVHVRVPSEWGQIYKGTVLYLSVEIVDIDVHPAPFSRIPRIGNYEDWSELLKFGVRCEWQTPQGWQRAYLQRGYGQEFAAKAMLNSYLTASRLNQHFRGYVYDNVSEDRGQFPIVKTITPHFNNLTRVLKLTEEVQQVKRPEPKMFTIDEMNDKLRDCGFLLRLNLGRVHKFKEAWMGLKCDTCLAFPSKSCTSYHVGINTCDRCAKLGRNCTWNGSRDLESRGLSTYVQPFPFTPNLQSIPDQKFFGVSRSLRLEELPQAPMVESDDDDDDSEEEERDEMEELDRAIREVSTTSRELASDDDGDDDEEDERDETEEGGRTIREASTASRELASNDDDDDEEDEYEDEGAEHSGAE